MEERSRYLTLSANRNCPDEQNRRRRKMVMRMDLGVLVQVLSLFFSFYSGGVMVAAERWDGIIISQANYDGLQAFKKSLVDPNGYLKSWNGTGIGACSGEWVGIKCVKGQVIAIQLPWKGLAGKISGKIGQLTALRKISLHDNSIGGGIPPEIGFLSDLRGLYLFNNRFSGSIPPEIGKCFVLQTLDLSQNFLSSGIPVTLSNSSRLYRLNLSYNNLTGTIPVGLTGLSTLTFFSVNNNDLSGEIPDTWGRGGMGVDGDNKISSVSGNQQQLKVLNLDNNSFSGPLPNSITKLRTLKVFSAAGNRINGSIVDVEFGKLVDLQLLDLSGNNITGFFPSSVCNLSSLLQLRLGGNHIEEGLPSAIDGMKNLTVLDLKNNRLNGSILATIGNMSRLSELDLSDNRFTGEIPESLVGLQNLTRFNVSDNQLSGQVPLALAKKFGNASFSGNLQLCGYTSAVPCPSPPPPPSISLPPTISPTSHRGKFSTREIILIIAGCVLVFLLLICCILLICLYKKRSSSAKKTPTTTTPAGGKAGATTAPPESESGGDAGGKLVHFDGPMAFTADDLLCATAEIMGKSTYGTVYKATLEDGSQVAVKRLREKISKGQKEFETEVNLIGKIRHQNLLALRAYYLGPKGEKLLVFDYMPKGSVAAFLHARGPDTPIDWPTRMKIAIGTTRGLLHLHTAHNIIHGNMTSTNILLDDTITPKIADFGLSRLMTTASSATVIATAGALGYRAPELSKLKKANTKTDVYSLGVVILELLTGKLPGEAMNGVDLPQWVASIVKEEWTNEVFDLELIRDAAAGDELLNTLKLALHCVDPSPAARPEVQEVLQQLEQIKPEMVESTSGSAGGGCPTEKAEGAGAGKEEK